MDGVFDGERLIILSVMDIHVSIKRRDKVPELNVFSVEERGSLGIKGSQLNIKGVTFKISNF